MKRHLLYKAQIVLPDQVIPDGSLLIENGQIKKIYEGKPNENIPGPIQFLDCYGMMILPGIIDLHTDALDHEISPRPGANFPVEIAVREMERKMSGCGFTTVYHAMHLGYKEAESQSQLPRVQVFEEVHEAIHNHTLIQNKIHLRFEITGAYAYEECMNLLDKGLVDLLSFMDHTPGQGQFGEERFIAHLKEKGLTEEEAIQKLHALRSRPKASLDQLKALADKAREKDIPIASHDDDSPDKVDMWYNLGVRICEFPINEATAKHATKKGMAVIGGAANVLRGGSLSGNLDIFSAVHDGSINSLCSDYYPPSMIHSLIKLVDEGDLNYPEAANLISYHPARAVGLDHETGSIQVGKNADVIILKWIDDIPLIAFTLIKGQIVSSARFPELDHMFSYVKQNQSYHPGS